MLKECILYAKENHSKLYVCYLDVQKAYDRMWHNGLFVKLYDMGLRSNLLGIIIELHSDMISCVLYKGHKSDWFKILQGSRQGGVLSPFMFLCYNDDLLEQLTKCTVGFKMLNINVSCPTVADDMILLALSISGLALLLCICYAYSCNKLTILRAAGCGLRVAGCGLRVAGHIQLLPCNKVIAQENWND